MATTMITEFARGTPGYRAPELLVQEKYDDKVDIWAMGCILYELVTGERLFSSDIAVLEYRQFKLPLTIQCDETFDKLSITSAILQTLEINPSLRPTAAELHHKFSCNTRITSQQSTLSVIQSLDAPDAEDWGGNLSWAQPNLKSFPVFGRYGSTTPTNWVVLAVVVNRPNTRITIISSDAEQETLSIKLCNPCGDVIWQKNSTILNTIQDVVFPAFSEDGECMAVFLEDRIEVIDARRGSLISIQSNNSIQPTAIAVGQNGKILAISSEKEGTAIDASLSRVMFRQGEKSRSVHMIWTTMLKTVSLTYLASDHRLYVIGKVSDSYCAFCWEVNTRILLNRFSFGYNYSRVEGPLSNILVVNEPCIMVRLRHLDGPHPNSLHVYSAGGRIGASFFNDHCMAQTTIAGNVIILTDDKRLLRWDGGVSGPYQVANIECDEMPHLYEIKGVAILERQLTFVLDNEQFILLQRN